MPEPLGKAEIPLPYNSQVFFWISEYIDGSILSQFDLDDGHEILFKKVDQSRLRSFGWYPVTAKLKELVKDQELRVVPFLPTFRLYLGPSQKLIAHRQNHLHLVEPWLCLECGCQWLYDDKPNALGLAYSKARIDAVDKAGSKYVSPVCPKCGAYTTYVCPKCNLSRSRPFMKPSDPWICLECSQPLPDKTSLISFEERRTFYVLGYEEAGQKHTIRIDESGNVEMG